MGAESGDEMSTPTPDNEKMGLEEAQEEADVMQKEVESGRYEGSHLEQDEKGHLTGKEIPLTDSERYQTASEQQDYRKEMAEREPERQKEEEKDILEKLDILNEINEKRARLSDAPEGLEAKVLARQLNELEKDLQAVRNRLSTY